MHIQATILDLTCIRQGEHPKQNCLLKGLENRCFELIQPIFLHPYLTYRSFKCPCILPKFN